MDCMIALPIQLSYSTLIPGGLWLLDGDWRSGTASDDGRQHACRSEILFIDARHLGHMVDRTHRELDDDGIKRIAGAYHAWRDMHGGYEDKPGFRKGASLEEVLNHDHTLISGRYAAAEPHQDDSQPFPEMMARFAA